MSPTPNLDALAAKSVGLRARLLDRVVHGQELGPLLIGKYPSETLRDGGHFNKYLPAQHVRSPSA